MTVRDTTVYFDMSRGRARVLNNINIDIRRGEVLGVVGESGSGKSMFASALLDDIVDPGTLEGDITYHSKDGNTVSVLDLSTEDLREFRWETISMVFQGAMSSFNPTQTFRQHFRETLDAHGSDMVAGMEFAKELLSDLYLEPERVLNSYPHELSGGQQQRTLIALSLVLDPEVLVLDEPTGALDLLMQRSIINLLYDIKDRYNLTLVFISHDLPLVAGFADRLAVMYAFEFVEVGNAADVLRNGSHPYTRALLRATPALTTPFDEMHPIEGDSPDPIDIKEKCSYSERCPLTTEQCRTEDPQLESIHDPEREHRAACFHWDEAADAIPLNLEGDNK
jgi:oligopeptide/dipeptide ABC transporter ATP-binding protein